MSSKHAAGKNKSFVKSPEKQQGSAASCYYIAFWSLAALLFFPPYFRGLFFPYEQELALIFAAIIFWVIWLWKLANRDYNFLSHPMDYAMLALPVIYLIAAFQAVNYALAVNEVVKSMLYFMVFWLVARIVRNNKEISTVLHVSYLSAIGVALAGLMTATAIISINDGFLDGRIYSTFQYPNALASFLGALTLVGLYLWFKCITDEGTSQHSSAWWEFSNLGPYLYAAGNFIIFAVFLGTKSNGGLIVFAIALILFITGLPKGRWPVSIHFLLFGIPAVVTIWQFIPNAIAGRTSQSWLWVLLGLVLTLALQWLYNYLARKGLLRWLGANKRIVIAAALLIIIAGSVGAGVYISGHSESTQALIQEFRLRNATERMAFFRDAMKMFQERPVLGWGGGGWEEAYRAYQSYLYNSNQVHGYFFQVMVETGVLGLIVVLGIWITFLHAAHRVYHRNKEDKDTRLLVWTVTIAAIAIGLHAVIDFDLSLSALTIVLWTFFGITRALSNAPENAETVKKVRKYEAPKYSSFTAATILSILIIILSGCLATANNSYKSALANLQLQNYSKGTALLQAALAYNPLSGDYYSALANVSQRQGKIDEAIVQAQRAIDLGKYNPARHAQLASLYYNGKRSDEEIIAVAEKALALAPFQSQWYDYLARTYFIVGYKDIIAGNNSNARYYLQKTTTVSRLIEERMATLSDIERKLWNVAPLMTPSPAVKLYAGSAQYLLGDLSGAQSNLKFALDNEETKGEASLWLALVLEKLGEPQAAQQLLDQATKLVPDIAKSYEELRNLSIAQ